MNQEEIMDESRGAAQSLGNDLVWSREASELSDETASSTAASQDYLQLHPDDQGHRVSRKQSNKSSVKKKKKSMKPLSGNKKKNREQGEDNKAAFPLRHASVQSSGSALPQCLERDTNRRLQANSKLSKSKANREARRPSPIPSTGSLTSSQQRVSFLPSQSPDRGLSREPAEMLLSDKSDGLMRDGSYRIKISSLRSQISGLTFTDAYADQDSSKELQMAPAVVDGSFNDGSHQNSISLLPSHTSGLISQFSDQTSTKELQMAPAVSDGLKLNDGSHRIPLRSQSLGRMSQFSDQTSTTELQMAPAVSDGLMNNGSHRIPLRSHSARLVSHFSDQASTKGLQLAPAVSDGLVNDGSHRMSLASLRSHGSGRMSQFSDQVSTKELQLAPAVSDGLVNEGSFRLSSLQSRGSSRNLSASCLNQESSKELQMADGVYYDSRNEGSCRLSSLQSRGSLRNLSASCLNQESSKELQMAPAVSDGLVNEGSFRLSSLQSLGSSRNLSASCLNQESSKELQMADGVYHDSRNESSFHLSGSLFLDLSSERELGTRDLLGPASYHDSSNSFDLLRLVGPRRASTRELDEHNLLYAGQFSEASMRNDTAEVNLYGSRSTLTTYNTEFYDEPIQDGNQRTRPRSIQYAPVQPVPPPQPPGRKCLSIRNKSVVVVIVTCFLIGASMAGMIFTLAGRPKEASIPTNEPTPSPTQLPSIQPSNSYSPSTSASPTGSSWLVQSRIEGPSFGTSVQLTTDLLVFSNTTYIFTYTLVDDKWVQSDQKLPGDQVVLSQTRRILVREGLVVKAYDLVGGLWSRVGGDLEERRINPVTTIAISGDGLTIAVSGIFSSGFIHHSYMYRYDEGERDWVASGEDPLSSGALIPDPYDPIIGTSFSYDGSLFAFGASTVAHQHAFVNKAPVGAEMYWTDYFHAMNAFDSGPAVALSGGKDTVGDVTFLTGTRGRVRAFNVTRFERVFEYSFFDESNAIPMLALSLDGKIIAFAYEKTLRVFEKAGGAWDEKLLPSSFASKIDSLSFCSDLRLAVGQPKANVVEILVTSKAME